MSYKARDIKDRVAVGDDLFQLEKQSDGIRYRLIPAPDAIVEEGTSVDKALLQPIEDELERLAGSLPETTAADAGKALVVQADGTYGLGDVQTEVADEVIADGTEPVSGKAVAAYAQKKANASTTDLTAGTSELATGEVYFVYE